MQNNKIIIYMISIIISGCTAQIPAPIEYNYLSNSLITELEERNNISAETLSYQQLDNKDEHGSNILENNDEDVKETRFEVEEDRIYVPKIYNSKETLLKDNKTTDIEMQAEKDVNKLKINNTKKFFFPVKGKIISKFGQVIFGRKNSGINISAQQGESVKCIDNGKVIFAGYNKKFGNLIIIKSNSSNLYIAYAHLEDLLVEKGETISRGQTIGHVGQSGEIDSPQLHLAIREEKTAVNPLAYLQDE